MRTRRGIYPHAQLPPREKRQPHALIVTESLFSMDGDFIDIASIVNDLGEQDALLIDEAHALGVYGPNGAGLAYGIDDSRIVVMGTLSKSLGSLGGFIAGPASLIALLENVARTFIFDTALPPAIALAARIALTIARKADDKRERIRENAIQLRTGLAELGIDTAGASHIVPIILGQERTAMRVGEELFKHRIYAPPVRPPTVPVGTSRLRVSLRSDHTPEHIDILLKNLQNLLAVT